MLKYVYQKLSKTYYSEYLFHARADESPLFLYSCLLNATVCSALARTWQIL